MLRSAPRDEEFAEFVSVRSPHLYRSAYLLTMSPHGAEDLVQSAMAKTYAEWTRVRTADDPVAYVHGILVKTFLSDRRRRSWGELPTGDLPDRVTTDPDPSDRAALVTALAQLGPTDRAVVVLRFWEDRSVIETAAELGLTPAAVKNRSHRALRILRGLLADTADSATSTRGSTR